LSCKRQATESKPGLETAFKTDFRKHFKIETETVIKNDTDKIWIPVLKSKQKPEKLDTGIII